MALCARLEQFDIQATLTDGPDGQTLHVVDPTDGHHLVWRLYQGPLAGTIERLARQEGQWVGPEGAACFVALEKLVADAVVAPGEKVVLFQTGHPANYY